MCYKSGVDTGVRRRSALNVEFGRVHASTLSARVWHSRPISRTVVRINRLLLKYIIESQLQSSEYRHSTQNNILLDIRLCYNCTNVSTVQLSLGPYTHII